MLTMNSKRFLCCALVVLALGRAQAAGGDYGFNNALAPPQGVWTYNAFPPPDEVIEDRQVAVCLDNGVCEVDVIVNQVDEARQICDGEIKPIILLSNGPLGTNKMIRWRIIDNTPVADQRELRFPQAGGVAVLPPGVTQLGMYALSTPKEATLQRLGGGSPERFGGGIRLKLSTFRYQVLVEFRHSSSRRLTCEVDPLIVNVGS
jgi:hypothetical protein